MRKSDNRKQCRVSILALALALAPWSAQAAGLGKLTVLSALGEPLRAEIELSATSDEYASMAARMASPQAFKSAGIEFAPALSSLRFSLERRPSGQPYVAVKSDRPINDPFVDMLIEVNWSSGRLVREYTFLLDPPELFRAPPVAAAPEVRKEEAPPAPAPEARKEAAPPPVAAPEKAAPEKAAPAKAAPPKAAERPAPAENARTVKKGDTLGKIASETRPEGVSLDQMLVALFRNNPDAFEGGNMNRLRAGKILGLPDRDVIAAVDAGEARKIVVAQSADFNAYRKKLAELAAAQPAREEAPQQAAGGKITPRVEEKKAPAPAPGKDKLEVSRTEAAKQGKPGTGRGVSEEDLMARDKALKDAQTRIAQLEKNLSDLRRLAEMRSAAGAKVQQQAEAAKPGAPAPKAEPAPKPAEAPKPAPAPAVPEAAKTAEAPVPAAQPVAKPPAPPPAVEPPAPPPSFVEENPSLVFGGAGILALLLGWFGYKNWRNRRLAQAAPESVIGAGPAASVFGTTGGQSIDTGVSLPTDFSQDSAAAVGADEGIDPVAEADVYMAYGRDRQAEEILLEALKNEPARAAIHLKLLEIYASRKSAPQFEAVARELHGLTGGAGPDWEKAAALGRSLDPANPLYSASASAEAEEVAAGTEAESAPLGTETMVMPGGLAQLAAAEAPAEAAEAEAPAAEEHAEEAPLSLDFDLDLGEAPATAAPVPAEEAAPADDGAGLDFDLGETSAPAEAAAETEAQPALEAAEGESGGLDFDLTPPEAASSEQEAAEPESAKAEDHAAGEVHALDFDFDLGEPAKPAEPEAPAQPAGDMPLDLSAISLELGEPETPVAEETRAAPALEAGPASAEEPPLEVPSLEEAPIEAPPIEAPIEEPSIEVPSFEAPALEMPSFEVPSAEAAPAEPALPEVATAAVDNPEVATKLELAQAYEEMGDKEGARELLNEVLNEGSPAQQEAARARLALLG